MPRLRRLTGAELVRLLERLGFTVVRIRGSHHILRRTVGGQTQTVNVPVHKGKTLSAGLLKRLYRELLRYVAEDDLRHHFYAD